MNCDSVAVVCSCVCDSVDSILNSLEIIVSAICISNVYIFCIANYYVRFLLGKKEIFFCIFFVNSNCSSSSVILVRYLNLISSVTKRSFISCIIFENSCFVFRLVFCIYKSKCSKVCIFRKTNESA